MKWFGYWNKIRVGETKGSGAGAQNLGMMWMVGLKWRKGREMERGNERLVRKQNEQNCALIKEHKRRQSEVLSPCFTSLRTE